MKTFSGFPAKMQFTPVPNVLFSGLLADISDMAELKTLLYVFWSIYGKRGYLRFTTYHELARNTGLMNGLDGPDKSGPEVLRGALAMAVKRGTLLHVNMEQEGDSEDVYFLNTEKDRQIVEKVRSSELSLPGLNFKKQNCPEPVAPPPDIFTLYEENIGLLTPMIAEELRAAEKIYPASWFRDAIKRAVEEHKHKWSYIQAILERWAREGKDDGTYQRDFRKTDPDKYVKGKYGHMVQR